MLYLHGYKIKLFKQGVGRISNSLRPFAVTVADKKITALYAKIAMTQAQGLSVCDFG